MSLGDEYFWCLCVKTYLCLVILWNNPRLAIFSSSTVRCSYAVLWFVYFWWEVCCHYYFVFLYSSVFLFWLLLKFFCPLPALGNLMGIFLGVVLFVFLLTLLSFLHLWVYKFSAYLGLFIHYLIISFCLGHQLHVY